MPDEKSLRRITVNGNDLLSCLAKEESNEYFEEEGKGKKLYHRVVAKYKPEKGCHGEIRQWTSKEIQMYEQLKDCKTATEMILLLLKTEKEVSAVTATDLLKDHPQKPGSRGLAQAIQRIYQRMEYTLEKRLAGREVFYHFAREEYKEIDLENLYACYRGKLTWDDIKPILKDEPDSIPSSKTLLEYVKEFEQRIKGLEEVSKIFLNTSQPSVQRHDVHFYFHFNFGKED